MLSALKYGQIVDYRNAGIHKMCVRVANRGDPDQTVSEEAV